MTLRKDRLGPYQQTIAPLFEALPLESAMARLVIDGGGSDAASSVGVDASHIALCRRVVSDPALADQPALQAGLWLYVDELDASHTISQSLSTPEGSFWHAIMHRREGDFFNSKYWYRQVGSHHVFESLDLSADSAGGSADTGGYDPYTFVDRVERDGRRGQNPAPDLIATQRLEWLTLMAWCAQR